MGPFSGIIPFLFGTSATAAPAAGATAGTVAAGTAAAGTAAGVGGGVASGIAGASTLAAPTVAAGGATAGTVATGAATAAAKASLFKTLATAGAKGLVSSGVAAGINAVTQPGAMEAPIPVEKDTRLEVGSHEDQALKRKLARTNIFSSGSQGLFEAPTGRTKVF